MVTDIHIINMSWGASECVLCGQIADLDYSVPYYEGPVHQEIGTKLPNGDEVGGMLCCKPCYDAHEASPKPLPDMPAAPDSPEPDAGMGVREKQES